MALSEVDGNLSISVNGNLFFEEDNICLAEFAAKLFNWLKNDYPDKPFIYESMDYEDSPIIQVEVTDDKVALSSVWGIEGIDLPVMAKRNDFVDSANIFLNKFEEELPNISSLYKN